MSNLILPPSVTPLLEPNLLVPGRKPVGPVVVNQQHPAASYHLACGQLFRDSMTRVESFQPLDIAGSNPPFLHEMVVAGGSPTLGVLGGQRTLILNTVESGDTLLYTGVNGVYDFMESQFHPGNIGAFSIAIQFYISAYPTSDEASLCGIGADGGGAGLYVYQSQSGNKPLKVAYGNWSTNVIGSYDYPPLKRWNTLVVTTSGYNSRVAVFLNGMSIGAGTGGSLSYPPEGAHFKLGSSIGTSYTNSLNGGVSSWLYWQDTLPDPVARDLSSDLYQIFSTPFPPLIFPAAGTAPPGGTITPIVRYHRHIHFGAS